MLVQRSKCKIPVIKGLVATWDNFKEIRTLTPKEERKWYVPEPKIVWLAESIRDLQDEMDRIEVNDKVLIRHATRKTLKENMWVGLEDSSGSMELKIFSNPFGMEPATSRRALVRLLERAESGSELFDIRIIGVPLFDESVFRRRIGIGLSLYDARLDFRIPAASFELE